MLLKDRLQCYVEVVSETKIWPRGCLELPIKPLIFVFKLIQMNVLIAQLNFELVSRLESHFLGVG